MLDLVESLPPHSRVLDLGAGPGSFTAERCDICVVRLDLQIPGARKGGDYVSADAARMPFQPKSFDVVIANHSLEHFIELEETLREIGRVVKPGGGLYVAVPDAGTLADRVYRWLGKGGGHVNPFRDPNQVARLVQRLTGLEHRGTRVLYSSFSFLNANNFTARPPRKIALFASGNERVLAVAVRILRFFDRRFGTRLSHYGWAFYFGSAAPSNPDEAWINVCVRCGSGASAWFLRKTAGVRRGAYRCTVCGARNLLTPD